MTREQDVERRLSEWLGDGPVTAPPEVVDRALERTADRRQRRGLWRWFALPYGLLERWFPGVQLVRATTLAAVVLAVALTTLVVSVPLGGPGRAPEMDPSRPHAVSGVARLHEESINYGQLTRRLEVESGDARIDGEALQVVQIPVFEDTGGYFARGMMRVENAWGTWEGPIDVTTYGTGEEYEMASLTGTGAYEGFTYLYTVRHQSPEAERAVEGAIWPDEPPPLPDPSPLP